jgi:hypothetical protein
LFVLHSLQRSALPINLVLPHTFGGLGAMMSCAKGQAQIKNIDGLIVGSDS